jgi:hypothetical protein
MSHSEQESAQGVQGKFRVAGIEFRWYVEFQTPAYRAFAPGAVDVLRIVGERKGFDVALLMRTFRYHDGGSLLNLGPLVVLGDAFPTAVSPVVKGARIRVRPKLRTFQRTEVHTADVARIVAWCLSDNFRAVRESLDGNVDTGQPQDFSIDAPMARIFQAA